MPSCSESLYSSCFQMTLYLALRLGYQHGGMVYYPLGIFYQHVVTCRIILQQSAIGCREKTALIHSENFLLYDKSL